jgi:hypothetical protein
MENLITGASTPIHTFAIKEPEVESQPEVRFINEADFQGFTYTGISIEIPTPLVKTSSIGLFGINVDGFIPTFSHNAVSTLYRNLFPVQVTDSAINTSGLEIYHEVIALPVLTNYLCHRYVSGDIGIAMRITSNTSQAGNLLIAQTSGVSRNYYLKNETYKGLQFLNSSNNPSDFAPNGMCVVDLSLNRHVAITPVRRCNTGVMDLAKKIVELDKAVAKTTNLYPFLNQFLEDWLLFGIQTTIPHETANIINLAFYFDWSRVKFYTPMLPYIPRLPLEDGEQILLYINTFKNKTAVDNVSAWTWWPKQFGAASDLVKFRKYVLDVPITSKTTKRVASYVKTLIDHRNEFSEAEASDATKTTTGKATISEKSSTTTQQPLNNNVYA